MGDAVITRSEKAPRQSPRDRLYGDASPDDVDEGKEEELEEGEQDENPDDFERGKSQPGAREQRRKPEQTR